ncbi:MAG: prepilin-type N-terminal cleavage/methylation domain-containing protein [Gemmatimonadales bacterium]|nr:prepilin-type N-terminal cleavage/methylation domain-containing protein [Gemmatimonadales bacterium]
MNHRPKHGFTLVEVAIALVLLIVGILGLVSSSAMVTRMIGQGRQATLVSQVATARIEWLRRLAGSTSPPCAHPQLAGGGAVSSGIREQWVVASAGNARRATLWLEYRVPRGLARDSLLTVLLCRPPS